MRIMMAMVMIVITKYQTMIVSSFDIFFRRPWQSWSRAGWWFASKTSPFHSFGQQSLPQLSLCHHSTGNNQLDWSLARNEHYSHSQRGKVCPPHGLETGWGHTQCPSTCWWSCLSSLQWGWSWRRSRRTCSSASPSAGRGWRSSHRWACRRGSCPGTCWRPRGCSSSTGYWQPRCRGRICWLLQNWCFSIYVCLNEMRWRRNLSWRMWCLILSHQIKSQFDEFN